MPTDRQAGRQIAASLACHAGTVATASQVADATVAAWTAVCAALAPIVGQRGVAALYKRSLHLNRKDHAWLEAATRGSDLSVDTALLRSALITQNADDAAAAAAAVLQTFYELLAMLVGPALTERLLRSVWANFSSGPPAQDIPR